MASLNKVQLIGNLGRNPEVRYLPDGTAVAQISLATTEAWKDKASGERVEATEWHRIVFFRGLAEIVGQHLVQGSTIHVEGKLRTRKYSKDGVDRFVTEIRADELLMLGGKRKEEGKPAPQGERYRDEQAGTGDDDVPF